MIPTTTLEVCRSAKLLGMQMELCHKCANTLKFPYTKASMKKATINPAKNHTLSWFRYARDRHTGHKFTGTVRHWFWYYQASLMA
jgi:hypothetical protein